MSAETLKAVEDAVSAHIAALAGDGPSVTLTGWVMVAKVMDLEDPEQKTTYRRLSDDNLSFDSQVGLYHLGLWGLKDYWDLASDGS